jgi:uridine kinase
MLFAGSREKARQAAEDLLKDVPASPLVSEAIRTLAIAAWGDGSYRLAATHLTTLAESSIEPERTQLRIAAADCLFLAKDFILAEKAYAALQKDAADTKLSEDAFKLKLGEDIFTVDYDHSTGRFTEPEHIEPAPYTIFCGLHTLYKESLRELCDLKIYIDTHEELKMLWKMERDTTHRGTSAERLLQTMERRKPDFKTFIDPQKDSADIIFHYAPGPESSVNFHLKVRPPYIQYVHDGLIPYSENIIEESDRNTYTFRHDISAEMLSASAQKLNYRIHRLKDGHDGLIQYIILLLTWKY